MRLFSSLSAISGLVLVIVIAWALAAVLMLTQTLNAAGAINEDVQVIEGDLTQVDETTRQVALTEQINETAAGILEAAEPLDGQLDQVISSTESIDSTVASILGTASSINSTAGAIGGNVDSIHGRLGAVRALGANEILPGVQHINREVDTATQSARSIERDLSNTLTQVAGAPGGGVHDHANSIDCGLANATGLGLVIPTFNCSAHTGD